MPVVVHVVFNHFPAIIAKMGLVDPIVEATANLIRDEAKANAPILKPGTVVSTTSPRYPGQLRDSIESYKVAHGHWRVAANAEYAAYVEYGTVNNPPMHYLIPAAHNNEQTLIDQIAAAIRP